jgi:voltage-gated potassium channel
LSRLPSTHHSWLRLPRAFWRDTLALWHEFRRPVLAFVVATIGGGLLYGEVWAQIHDERIPIIELPYMMIQLMTLQGIPEVTIPPEPPLVVFWYVMPLVGLYVIGRGVVDFARVFFNRGERRKAWEVALASTYHDHIIVVGIGNVGLRVIRSLRELGFEVVAIDSQPAPERWEELRHLGVPLVVGDGSAPETLNDAGIKDASSLLICTSNDYINLTVAMRGRDLNSELRIVVRMWDDRFAEQLRKYVGVEAVLSASELAAPAFAGAAFGMEIAQTLQVRDEAYSIFRLQVEAGGFMDGKMIEHLQDEEDMDIVLLERDSQVQVHPEGNIVVRAGDTLVIFARHAQIIRIARRNRRSRQ